MGALAGVLYEDVRPIDDAQLAALAEGNRPLGTDAAGVHREDGIFLVGLTQRLDPLGDSAVGPTGGFYPAYPTQDTNNGATRADPDRWNDRRDGAVRASRY